MCFEDFSRIKCGSLLNWLYCEKWVNCNWIVGGIIMVKIVIFVLGLGSNFENIVEYVELGKFENIEVMVLYMDH